MTTTATSIRLTPDQQQAASAIRGWLRGERGERHELIFSGLAGTGKSTVIAELYDELREAGSLFMCPSAKAAYVLRQRGVPAVTIHSAIYLFNGTHERDDGREVPIFTDREGLSDSLPYAPKRFIVDEASMVDDTVYSDIMSKDLPTLWVGDRGQLPPVGPDPGIMSRPHVSLEQVHRQADGSGILRLAHDIRQGGTPSRSHEAHDVKILSLSHPRLIAQYAIKHGFDQVICAFNKTRHQINSAFRFALRKRGLLDTGDRIICRFNNRRAGLFNGQQFIVDRILAEDEVAYTCDLRMDMGGVSEGEYRRAVRAQKISLGNADYKSSERAEGCNVFEHGYCITAHLSQGSGFGRVLVVYQPCRNWSMSRWGYTAVTRAEDYLGVVV